MALVNFAKITKLLRENKRREKHKQELFSRSHANGSRPSNSRRFKY